MVTGDHPVTAVSVAEKAKLIPPQNGESPDPSDAKITHGDTFARTLSIEEAVEEYEQKVYN